MRYLMVMSFLSVALFSNTQPYKKDIILEPVSEPSLVKVELDDEIYRHTSPHHADVRLQGSQGVEGYFIRPLKEPKVINQQTLHATRYNREEATLVYSFREPFVIEEVELHIEDRNFESLVDIYADGTLVLKNGKIFDYSKETGTQNFKLKIPKTEVKKITVIYHLDQTTSFYKKYQHLREMSQYLTIKSVTFSNTLKSQQVWRKTSIKTEQTSTDEKKRSTTYLFNLQNIPFSKIAFDVQEKNFKRSAQLFFSKEGKEWHTINKVELSASTLGKESHRVIEQRGRIGYLKLEIFNGDNPPLTINQLEIFTLPDYLYFIANPQEQYALYFGDKHLSRPFYELESLVGSSAVAIEGKFSKLEPLEVDRSENKISFFEKHKEHLFIVVILLALGVMAYVAFGLLKRGESR